MSDIEIRAMLTLRTITPRMASPARPAVWLLEAGIALTLSAYMTYQLYHPLARDLNRSFDMQAGAIVAALALAAIVFPLLWTFSVWLVLLIAGLLPPVMRTAIDMVVLTILITALAVPALRDIVESSPAQKNKSPVSSNQTQTGPLNFAPEPLKLERIPIGAEVLNSGAQPIEVHVSFVKLNERGRSYCAGKPLSSGGSGRIRLGAGESMVFTSGNCQDGHVALTVWDAAGRRLYQTSAVAPSADFD